MSFGFILTECPQAPHLKVWWMAVVESFSSSCFLGLNYHVGICITALTSQVCIAPCAPAWGWGTDRSWCFLSSEAKGQEAFEHNHHNNDVFEVSAKKMHLQMKIGESILVYKKSRDGTSVTENGLWPCSELTSNCILLCVTPDEWSH